MVVRILALVLLLGMGVQAQSINKGIKIGHLNYSGDIHTTDTATARKIATVFDMLVSGGGFASSSTFRTAISNMRTYNPQLKTFSYETFRRGLGMNQDSSGSFANDSALIRNYLIAQGLPSIADFNKLFLFNISASSVTLDIDTKSPSQVATFAPGTKVTPAYFGPGQFTCQWDLRENKKIAGVLAYLYDVKFWQHAQQAALDGMMIDEESYIMDGVFGFTGGTETPWYPWRVDVNKNSYVTGSYISIGNTSKVPDWKDVGLSFTQVGDSLHKLRLQLWAYLQDSLTARRAGKTFMLNFGGYMDIGTGNPPSVVPFDQMGKSISDSAPYVLHGEFTQRFHTYADNADRPYWDWLPRLMQGLRTYRNNGYRFFDWGTRSLGPSDTTALDTAVTLGEVQLLRLGSYLLCTFPGTTEVTWGIARQNYGTNWYMFQTDPNTGLPPAFRFAYDTAFSFYHGVPIIDRDSSSGTDGNGVPYKAYTGIFLRPNSTDSLTWVAVRIRRKTTSAALATTAKVAGSKVNIVVPGSSGRSWYRLRSGRRWDTTPIAGGSTVRIANGEAIILSSDTTLANSGPSLTPSVGSVIIDSIRNDFSLEVDSIRLRLTAASSGSIDSIITAVNYVGFTTLDSSVANNDSTSFRKAVTSSGQTYSYYLLPGIGGGTGRSETYTVYVKSWHRHSTTGWSVAYQASRTYTVGQVTGPLSGFAAKEKGKLKNIGRTAIKRQP